MKKCLKCKSIFTKYEFCPECHSIWNRDLTEREKKKYIQNVRVIKHDPNKLVKEGKRLFTHV